MKPRLWFLFALSLLLGRLTTETALAQDDQVAKMPDGQKPTTAGGDANRVVKDPGVVNWDPPAKRELVQRAVSDGITDPAKIAEWARNYKVTMTLEEVRRIKAELSGKFPKGYELYSWMENGTIVYSLVPGTNRNKSLDEILHPQSGQRFENISALKKKIASLPEGEQIIWSNAVVDKKDRPRLVYPDIEVVKDLEKMARQADIELTVPKSGR